MKRSAPPAERLVRETLILVLEEWVVEHSKEMTRLNDPDYRYGVRDFFNVRDALMAFKGIGRETEREGKT